MSIYSKSSFKSFRNVHLFEQLSANEHILDLPFLAKQERIQFYLPIYQIVTIYFLLFGTGCHYLWLHFLIYIGNTENIGGYEKLIKTIIMKKLFKTFALIALTSFATFANDNAASNFEVGMYSINNSSKVRILLEKDKGTNLTISLKNEKGEVIFKEFVNQKSTSYNKYFNLSNLADGKYTFVIDNGSEKIMKVVETETTTNRKLEIL
ncbi:hypothetical protein SAMN06298216_0219 [Spirosomataceae bacterium TFI 002]|nr:hypothetical protein SAMN06298216_0219 [Spirosomataceae bacterium TFI 002]